MKAREPRSTRAENFRASRIDQLEAFPLFQPKTEQESSPGFPRAQPALSHAQKGRALESRMPKSLLTWSCLGRQSRSASAFQQGAFLTKIKTYEHCIHHSSVL